MNWNLQYLFIGDLSDYNFDYFDTYLFYSLTFEDNI